VRPALTVCGGGHYPHRYRATLASGNASVYCRDLVRLISTSMPRYGPTSVRDRSRGPRFIRFPAPRCRIGTGCRAAPRVSPGDPCRGGLESADRLGPQRGLPSRPAACDRVPGERRTRTCRDARSPGPHETCPGLLGQGEGSACWCRRARSLAVLAAQHRVNR